MFKFKKIAIALAAVTVMAGSTMAGQIQTGGNVPLVSTILGVGVLSLDFSGPGTLVNIGRFIMSSNDANFHVTWTFANKGVFKTANGLQTIAMTDANIVEAVATGTGGYVAGTGLVRSWVAGAPLGIYTTGVDATTTGNVSVNGTVTWTDVQSTATVNDQILINATWGNSATALYGLYTETITFACIAD